MSRGISGFTLIELMCAMAVGAVALLAAAFLLGSSGESYERASGGVAAGCEARAVIAQLGSDLSTARYHKDGVIEQSGASWPADRLGFLSMQPDAAQTDEGRIGDLCAVSYYIKDIGMGASTVRCLMRGFRDSRETFAALVTRDVASLFTERPGIDEPVAFGVVSFQAQPKVRDAAGRWLDLTNNWPSGPQAIDVRLVIARRGLAAKLKTSADWDGAGTNGKWLGPPGDAELNKDLEIFGMSLPYGNDPAK